MQYQIIRGKPCNALVWSLSRIRFWLIFLVKLEEQLLATEISVLLHLSRDKTAFCYWYCVKHIFP